jgi:hypothetical protein
MCLSVIQRDEKGVVGPGDFPLSIFDTVLNGITVRGSIVATRLDLQEALNFAGEGKVKATIATERLENSSDIFVRMHKGDIQGRIVIDFQQSAASRMYECDGFGRLNSSKAGRRAASPFGCGVPLDQAAVLLISVAAA